MKRMKLRKMPCKNDKEIYRDVYFKCYNRCKRNLKRLKSIDDCIFIRGTRIQNKSDCDLYCKKYTDEIV